MIEDAVEALRALGRDLPLVRALRDQMIDELLVLAEKRADNLCVEQLRFFLRHCREVSRAQGFDASALCDIRSRAVGILDYLRLARTAFKVAEKDHPETVKELPPWLSGGFRFMDGAESAYKKGAELWKTGGVDPHTLSDAQVLALIPEADRARFGGEPKQLVAALKTGYLTEKTASAFKSAAESGGSP